MRKGPELFSPAKLNLFLRIEGRRADGYHELSSLVQMLSLGDTLSFTPSDRHQLTAEGVGIMVGEDNLIMKAVALFCRETSYKPCVWIHLVKRIPVAAGLGGGSSNAATALHGMRKLSGLDISDAQLAEWGVRLGADVPCFFSSGTAYMQGCGERVRSLRRLEGLPFWLFKPKAGLATKEVYGHFRGQTGGWNAEEALEAVMARGLGALSWRNDLEEAAFRLMPSLCLLKARLFEAGFCHVMLAGSGSTFAAFGRSTVPPSLEEEGTWYPVTFVHREQSGWYVGGEGHDLGE